VCRQVKAPDLKGAMEVCEEFRTTTKHYGDMGPPLEECQLPYSKFAGTQVLKMLETELLSPFPLGEEILSGVKGWLKDEEALKRWRIITETMFNPTLEKDKLPPLSYRSGREVQANIAGKKYAIQFDYRGYYYQMSLGNNKTCYVVRVKEPVLWQGEWVSLFVMNKLPMGGAHSAHIAQTTTWCICEPIMSMDVFLATMIDNVLIAADNPDEFVKAVTTFLKRSDEFNATLKEREKYDINNPKAILKMGSDYAKGPSKFLGVVYEGRTVRNTERNVKKLQDAFQRLQLSTRDTCVIVTRRHVASIISLAAWMAYNAHIPLCNHPKVLKQFSMLEDKTGSWDQRVTITGAILNTLHPIVTQLCKNVPVEPHVHPLPSSNNNDYEITIIVDAYIEGWGGYVWVNGTYYRVRAGFAEAKGHSAHAEPLAATRLLRWAKAMYRPKPGGRKVPRVAVVTDHEAMAGRQMRPISSRGGFSPSYFLNEFYRELYGSNGRSEGQVFHVEGIMNRADWVSRQTHIGEPLTYEVITNETLPPLTEFFHPFSKPATRVWWNV
jgi:hypothetical protein